MSRVFPRPPRAPPRAPPHASPELPAWAPRLRTRPEGLQPRRPAPAPSCPLLKDCPRSALPAAPPPRQLCLLSPSASPRPLGPWPRRAVDCCRGTPSVLPERGCRRGAGRGSWPNLQARRAPVAPPLIPVTSPPTGLPPRAPPKLALHLDAKEPRVRGSQALSLSLSEPPTPLFCPHPIVGILCSTPLHY